MRYRIFFLLLLLSNTAFAALYTFDYSSCRFTIPYSGSSIAIGVSDMREFVRNGKHKPEYVGIMRGGFGNPWYVETESGLPFGDEVGACLKASFTAANFKVADNKLVYPDKDEQMLQKLKATTADRKMLLVIHNWESDLVSSFSSKFTDVDYDLELIVFDKNNKQIGTYRHTGKSEAIGKKAAVVKAHIKDHKQIPPAELVIQMNELLAKAEIAKCFKQAAIAGDDKAPAAEPQQARQADEDEPEAKPTKQAPATKATQQNKTVEELRQYKQLLDEGVITQEEYNAKKKKLLGL